MSTTGEMRKFRALLCAKWNEIITKFCINVLGDTCHGVMTGFNVKHLAIKRACDRDCIFLKPVFNKRPYISLTVESCQSST